jgi:SulP family sulfate permease
MNMQTIRKYFPFLDWMKSYSREDLSGDVSAGITVGVMLIPQGMAYAMLAGMPPIYGLYAATIPLIIYALMGTSRQLAVGPVAMVALLISSGVAPLAEVGSAQYVSFAILLALMVGVFQLLMGVFRLGFVVNFLSHPVISGFTSAAAIIIGLSQLKYLLGVDLGRSKYIHVILQQAFENIGNIHWPTFVLGVVAIGLIIALKKINKRIPGSLLVVFLGIAAVYFLKLDEGGMQILKDVPEGLPKMSAPDIDMEAMTSLFPVMLALSLVGFMESYAVAKALQAKHKNYEVVPNQELIGLGTANIVGSFFSSFPVMGGFGRSAVNDQAGARTGLASIISAVLIILTLLFLTPLFYYLPKTILASIIMVAVYGLIDMKEAKHLWKNDKRDFAMLFVTFLGTLFLGVEEGILIGVILSLVMVVFRSAYPHVAQLGQVQGTDQYRNVARFENAVDREDLLIIRPDSQLFFANINFIRDKWDNWEKPKGDQLKCVVFNAKAVNAMDSSAVHFLEERFENYRSRGVEFYISGLRGPLRDYLTKNGFIQHLGEERFFSHVNEAVNYYESDKRSVPRDITLQTNG